MMAFPTPIRRAMITLGGRPYAIQKLEGEAADRWFMALALFQQKFGHQPVEVAPLLAATYPCFIPWLSELLPKYDHALPWHDAQRSELLTALLAITHLNFSDRQMGGET
jgi:hypothetical protein